MKVLLWPGVGRVHDRTRRVRADASTPSAAASALARGAGTRRLKPALKGRDILLSKTVARGLGDFGLGETTFGPSTARVDGQEL